MQKLILYLSTIAVSCTCLAADFSGTVPAGVLLDQLFAGLHAPPSDDWQDNLSATEPYVLVPAEDAEDRDTPSSEYLESPQATPPRELDLQSLLSDFALLRSVREAQDAILARFNLEQQFGPENLAQDLFVPQDVLGASPLLPPEENYYDGSMDMDSATVDTPSAENPGLEERRQRNRIYATRSRNNMKLFRNALSQVLDERGIVYLDQRIKPPRNIPRPKKDNESEENYRVTLNSESTKNTRDNQRLELQSMVANFGLLDRQTQAGIIEKFRNENVPHIEMLLPLLQTAPEEDYHGDTMDTDSVAARTPPNEDPRSEEGMSRAERNRASAERSRVEMKLFSDALSQALDERGIVYSDQRIRRPRNGTRPRRDNESDKNYRLRCNRESAKIYRGDKGRTLQGMILVYNSLDQPVKDAIIAELRAQRIPRLEMLCPTPLAVLRNSQPGKLSDGLYDHLFLEMLHKQLYARGFIFLRNDRTLKSQRLSLLTAFHEHSVPEKHAIIKALKNAGISRAAWRLRTTPEELRERQERKKERSASARRMKELRSTQEYYETSDFVS